MVVVRVFASDCEGPLSKNDNALELSGRFIPNGGKVFTELSRYDDYLAYVVHKERYKPGNTLSLIGPSLRAYGVTNKKMVDFSRDTLIMIPGAVDTLQHVNSIMPGSGFIISTSYRPYLEALSESTGFPFENIYCTEIDIDNKRYTLSHAEEDKIKKFTEEIAEMPMIEIPEGATSIHGFSPEEQKAIRRLDKIFWEELPKMEIYKMIEDVNPLGGYEKANAIRDIARRKETEISNIWYTGDSITDVDAFDLVSKYGGLPAAFNGNHFALKHAKLAIMSLKTPLIDALVEVFQRKGKDGVMELADSWSISAVVNAGVSDSVVERLISLDETSGEYKPMVAVITEKNIKELIEISSRYRDEARGEAVSRLG